MDVRYGELPLDLLRELFTFEELKTPFLDPATRPGGDVEEAMKVARGRAHYASSTDLASFVFRDYIRNRRKLSDEDR